MGDRIDRSRLEDERDERTGRSAAAERIRNQTRWVDLQVQEAMRRGEFDDLPGAGKPLDLPDKHDPDWWVKQLIEREQITGIAPAAIGLRKEDAELDAVLDREASADGVRRVVTDFNARVVDARRQLTGGPPVDHAHPRRRGRGDRLAGAPHRPPRGRPGRGRRGADRAHPAAPAAAG